MKMLIVDNEKCQRDKIKTFICEERIEVNEILEADDTESANEIIREKNPEIVISDRKVSSNGGVEIIKECNFEELVGSLRSAIDVIEKERKKVADHDSFLFEIKAFIDQNFEQELSLEFFSKKYYLTKEHILRKFKKCFEHGIYEYVIFVRMEEAKKQLQETDLQVQEIAYGIGFNDNNYFSKAFKKRYGVTPNEFRRINQ